MEAIREQYGLTALRIGYTEGTRSGPGRHEVTCSLRDPGSVNEEWSIPAEGFDLLVSPTHQEPDERVDPGLAECLHRLQDLPAVRNLRHGPDPLWLAVTSEHPLLPAIGWE